MAIGILLKLLQLLADAALAVFSTVWPWLIMASLGLWYVAKRLLATWRRQRFEKRFFDALIAISTPGGDAGPLLSRLSLEAPGEADIPLLLALHSASAGDTSGALAAVDMALACAGTLGRLSGGLTLRFPGSLASLSFALHEGGWEALQVLRNDLLIRLGRAAEVVAPQSLSMHGPMRVMQLATAADASIAVGNVEQAIGALEQATAAGALPRVKSALQYKKARALEVAGNRDRAIAEYSNLLQDGGYEDAQERMDALVAARDEESLAQAVQRMKSARTVPELRAVLDAALREVTLDPTRQRLRRAAHPIEADVRSRLQAEASALEERVSQSAIEQLVQAKTTAARQSVLDRALANISDAKRAERLRAEATRIEAEAQALIRAQAEEEQARRHAETEQREEYAFERALREMRVASSPALLEVARERGLSTLSDPTRRERFQAAATKVSEEVHARWTAELEAEEENAFRRTVIKMEAARGPAGRRSALEAGLREITSPQKRERLLVEASRIEVEAVLDKVDGLKTAAAKKRNLQTALEALRNDDVPDELQAKQIQWLEDALAELDGRGK
ncbi:hypothetical protein [Polyangium sp. y55x31]|uniref:hypothetical protein n=1 Tax=Polyangium sp. y55x31 TaxID=3042688 RepID=UPI0024827264|nr:hypothetical protein [Polyangium sp. y55x31]MDI1476410.1 hypothetical protein [Polyangium sp. y55x31]